MAKSTPHNMSRRGFENIEAIMPKIQGAVEERKKKVNSNIDLATSENWLMRPELVELCKEAISAKLEPHHLSYPRGFAGDPSLLEAYASLFNGYFEPHTPVLSSHIATAPGAVACLDALLYNICDDNEGVLVPGPYWNGFDFGFHVRSKVKPILVDLDDIDTNFTSELIFVLEKALKNATCPVKALVITNPHNPLGICYSKDTLEQLIKFCDSHAIHFISDEVYGLSVFEPKDEPVLQPFVSVLSLDLDSLKVERSRVHMVWGTSKDFGQSGLRMGCAVTQASEEMLVGVALAANTQISALSSIFVTHLLTSPVLPTLIATNRNKLASAYGRFTSFLKRNQIEYMPCNAGLYIFAKLAPNAVNWEDEANTAAKLKEVGVLVSPGRPYHVPESLKGWMRLTFAVEEKDLGEAMQRMQKVFDAEHRAVKESSKCKRQRSESKMDDPACFATSMKRRKVAG